MLWSEPNDITDAKGFTNHILKIPVAERQCASLERTLTSGDNVSETGSCVVLLEQAPCWRLKANNTHVLYLPNSIFSGIRLVAKVGVFTPWKLAQIKAPHAQLGYKDTTG